MKFLLAFSLAFAVGVSAHADYFKTNNDKIIACNKAVNRFFSNVQLDRGAYLWGKNKAGKCHIYYYMDQSTHSMQMSLGAKDSEGYISMELHPVSNPNPTGMSNNLKQCDVTATSVTIRNVWRMPRTLYYGPKGLGRSLSIFDVRENQTMKLVKDETGRRVTIFMSDADGKSTCYFK